MSGSRLIGVVLVASITLGSTRGAAAEAPPEDRILSVDQYTSEKARTLATRYASALRELNARIYHCIPWLDVKKDGIGFFKPKGTPGDERHLSLNVYIEQDPSPAFATLRLEGRGASMFSRYVGPLLRRMAHHAALLSDPLLDGFTVILSWLSQGPRAAGGRPVHETIAAFMERPAVAAYLAGGLPIRELAGQARVLAWNGETPLGPLPVQAWDDNFLSTFKLANYQPEPGATCP